MEQPDLKQPSKWRSKLIQRAWPFNTSAMRPADISNALLTILLARQNVLEDVNYNKVAPNHFIVEIPQELYARDFEPIRTQVLHQWSERILRRLMTANSRLGRKEYRFAGRVRVEVRPDADLDPAQVRILYAISPDEILLPPASAVSAAPGAPCLESIPTGRRHPLTSALITLGRDAACEVVLDTPAIRQARLISGRHAHIRYDNGRWLLFDGAPYGRPSLNGTFVNGRAAPAHGHALQTGDVIILAALDPNAPRADTPGTATFRFRTGC